MAAEDYFDMGPLALHESMSEQEDEAYSRRGKHTYKYFKRRKPPLSLAELKLSLSGVETDKAVMLRLVYNPDLIIWMPKSCMEISDADEYLGVQHWAIFIAKENIARARRI